MANTLLGDLNCFTPAFAEFDDAGNSFSSNPDYDEASGPPKDDWFVTVGELEEHAGEDYMLMRQLEEPEDLEQRLYWIDPDEPLGHGETESMVREQARNSTPLASPSTRITVRTWSRHRAACVSSARRISRSRQDRSPPPSTCGSGAKSVVGRCGRKSRARSSSRSVARSTRPPRRRCKPVIQNSGLPDERTSHEVRFLFICPKWGWVRNEISLSLPT